MRSAWPLTIRGTGAVVLALACFIIAGSIGSVQLLAFGVFLLVLAVAGVVALHIAHRDITVDRVPTPDAVAVGQTTRVTVHVSMRTALPTTPGVWRDDVPDGLRGRSDGRFPGFGSGLRGGERAVNLVYQAEGVHRGMHVLGPLRVVVRDPFGIARRVQTVGGTTHITVTPACLPLPPLTAFAGRADGALHATSTRLGQGSDDLIARPYQAGDSMRRIHWRATAHVDTLMVRQEERESTPEAVVILDRASARWAKPAGVRPGNDPGFENAVTMCVSAVTALLRDGYAVHVWDAAGLPLCETVADGAAARALAVRCATVTAQPSAPLGCLTRLLASAMTGPLVVVTGTVSQADIGELTTLPAHSAHPVLLAAAAAPGALEQAGGDGWFTASIAPDEDLREAWESVRADVVLEGDHRVAV